MGRVSFLVHYLKARCNVGTSVYSEQGVEREQQSVKFGSQGTESKAMSLTGPGGGRRSQEATPELPARLSLCTCLLPGRLTSGVLWATASQLLRGKRLCLPDLECPHVSSPVRIVSSWQS